jgi:hypothetical protein
MDRHCSADDGYRDAAVDDDDVDVEHLIHPYSNDPELKIDHSVLDLYDFDSSDCYDSLYADYDVVLDAAVDGTIDMEDVVVDEVQQPYPWMELSFVERIQGHPQRVYGQHYCVVHFLAVVLIHYGCIH